MRNLLLVLGSTGIALVAGIAGAQTKAGDSCGRHYQACMNYMAKAAASSHGSGVRGCQTRYDACMATPGATGTYTNADGKVHAGLLKQ